MALPSYGSHDVAPSPLARMLARVRALLAEKTDNRIAQLVAGKVFMVRLASALLALVSQVLLARWMGRFEFGVYIYVWTWVLMIGALSDVGLSSAARRFIPEYSERKSFDLLRGFLTGSKWLAFAVAGAIGALGALGVWLLSPHLDGFEIVPLYLACLVIPVYGLVQIQAGIAQSYDWPNLALAPFYIWRQLAITALVGAFWLLGASTDAVTAMAIAAGATWAVTIGQLALLNRRLAGKVPEGPQAIRGEGMVRHLAPDLRGRGLLPAAHLRRHPRARAPALARRGRGLLRRRAPARHRRLRLFRHRRRHHPQVHAVSRRRRQPTPRHVLHRNRRWTFWPSLAVCALILACGLPLLSLFGAGFTAGYGVMFILAIGMLSRAAVGPAERLLNMLGERRQCAIIYATAFATNLALCVVVDPAGRHRRRGDRDLERAGGRVGDALRRRQAAARPSPVL